MGYETKLIVGILTDFVSYKNKDCLCVLTIAEIDLCKCCFVDTYVDKEIDTTKVFVNASNGDTEITKDCYGSQLFAIEPKKVLKAMQAANTVEKYRRYNAAIPMLKSLIKDFKKENLVCVLYGH